MTTGEHSRVGAMWADEAEERLARYLLGRVSPELAAEIEERVVVDAGAREELLATADDLIDAYLRGGLSKEDRAGFEDHFLSIPCNRRRLLFMRDLLAAVERRAPRKAEISRAVRFRNPRLWVVWAAAAAVAVAAAGLHWLSRPAGPTNRPVARHPAATPPVVVPPEAAPAPPATRPSRADAAVRVVSLPSRPEAAVTLALSPGTSVVRLEVPVDDEHPSFDVVLLAAAGSRVWSEEGLVPSAAGAPLVVNLPARVLASGAYALKVTGEALRGKPDGRPHEYVLRVVREDRE